MCSTLFLSFSFCFTHRRHFPKHGLGRRKLLCVCFALFYTSFIVFCAPGLSGAPSGPRRCARGLGSLVSHHREVTHVLRSLVSHHRGEKADGTARCPFRAFLGRLTGCVAAHVSLGQARTTSIAFSMTPRTSGNSRGAPLHGGLRALQNDRGTCSTLVLRLFYACFTACFTLVLRLFYTLFYTCFTLVLQLVLQPCSTPRAAFSSRKLDFTRPSARP